MYIILYSLRLIFVLQFIVPDHFTRSTCFRYSSSEIIVRINLK